MSTCASVWHQHRSRVRVAVLAQPPQDRGLGVCGGHRSSKARGSLNRVKTREPSGVRYARRPRRDIARTMPVTSTNLRVSDQTR
jgi:hypothetical protein